MDTDVPLRAAEVPSIGLVLSVELETGNVREVGPFRLPPELRLPRSPVRSAAGFELDDDETEVLARAKLEDSAGNNAISAVLSFSSSNEH